MSRLCLWPLEGIPEVRPGTDLAALIAAAEPALADGDVVVVAHKVVSKAEGRTVYLPSVSPSAAARALARTVQKDPRLVEVILRESAAVVRARNGVLICRTRHGLVCANAGVDRSNVPDQETVVLLPADPDRAARQLRGRLTVTLGRRLGVVITDSFGRAWRRGQQEVAIGVAGLAPLLDLRGRKDSAGRELQATMVAVADQLAGAADLVRSKASRQPVVVARGVGPLVGTKDGPGAASCVRPLSEDLFR